MTFKLIIPYVPRGTGRGGGAAAAAAAAVARSPGRAGPGAGGGEAPEDALPDLTPGQLGLWRETRANVERGRRELYGMRRERRAARAIMEAATRYFEAASDRLRRRQALHRRDIERLRALKSCSRFFSSFYPGEYDDTFMAKQLLGLLHHVDMLPNAEDIDGFSIPFVHLINVCSSMSRTRTLADK